MNALMRELTDMKEQIRKNVESGKTNPSFLSGFESAGRIVLKDYLASRKCAALRRPQE